MQLGEVSWKVEIIYGSLVSCVCVCVMCWWNVVIVRVKIKDKDFTRKVNGTELLKHLCFSTEYSCK